MAKGLIDWASGQPAWVSDSLRRIASAVDHALGEEDFACVLGNVRAAALAANPAQPLSPLEAGHLGRELGESRRTVLVQLGPVQNVDRLAGGQRLRMAPEGITLIYGENGSGKSGYTRIAKRLCRSLSSNQLRGNVFATATSGPMRIEVRYRVGDDEVSSIEWDPATPAPSTLRQISVFDSHNARLYVDGENKIAYLPRELAILEHHGDLCQRIALTFNAEETSLATRLRIPLPAGYAGGTCVSTMLAGLNVNNAALPGEDEIRRLAELSEAERLELTAFQAELASDPVALAAIRRRAATVLKRVCDVFEKLAADLSETVGERVAAARKEVEVATAAERMAASASFADEPVANVGGPAWRILFEAARAFMTDDDKALVERLPDAAGNLCALCLEPMSPTGAARLGRFNDFVSGEASKRADRARDALKGMIDRIEQTVVPPTEVVEESLAGYGGLDTARGAIAADITAALTQFASRRACLLDDALLRSMAPDVAPLVSTIARDRETLESEAIALQEGASHNAALDAKRARLADLKDRMKLDHGLETVLQRRRDLSDHKSLTDCLAQVATRPISNQITALRKLLVTEELEKRIVDEIAAFDLTHLPFKVSDSSSSGQSLFSVGLKGAGKVKNNQILSEGEQRALALACFLAEIGGDDARFGIIVDDPVSSLDHLRLRKVAQRLVAEAMKGRQVIVFTHNLVFFNEMVSEAAHAGPSAPLIKSVVSKTQADGFGVVSENSEPWIADLNARITALRERIKALKTVVDFDTDDYRRQAKDFYSDLRETWERAVEEVVLAKTVVRFVPDVMTGRLKEVSVTDEDYKTIFFAMKRASERSGHDMAAGRDIPQPTPDEMDADVKALDDFRIDYNKRMKAVSAARKALEAPLPATLI